MLLHASLNHQNQIMKIRFAAIFVSLASLLFCNSKISASQVFTERQPVSSGTANPPLVWVNSPDYTGCGGINVPVVNAAYEQEVVYLVNQERANAGLPPLKQMVELDEASRYHAADMAQDNYFEHDSYDPAGDEVVFICSTWDRIKTFYPSPSAENIAAGYSNPSSVMSGWMNSTGHRNNILSSNSWEIGVGYYEGGSWGVYWVQDFGRRDGVYPLIINQDAASTDSRSVSLYIYGSWTEIRLRNDDGDWSAWMPFQSTMNWELVGGVGAHTIWAEMRSDQDASSTSDTIMLTLDDNPPTPTPTRIPLTTNEIVFLPQVMNRNP